MASPPAKPFNPRTSAVPRLDSSSGDPRAFQDPNSVASVGARIQAMSDQMEADTLYDSPPPPREGFVTYEQNPYMMVGTDDPLVIAESNSKYRTWISKSESCRNEKPDLKLLEGFTSSSVNSPLVIAFVLGGAALMLCSFMK